MAKGIGWPSVLAVFGLIPSVIPLHVGPPSPLTSSGLRMLRSMPRVEATLLPRRVPKDNVIVGASDSVEPSKAVEAVERLIAKECDAIR